MSSSSSAVAAAGAVSDSISGEANDSLVRVVWSRILRAILCSKQQRVRWWHPSYIIDWAITMIVLLFDLICIQTLLLIPPTERPFSINDPSLGFPIRSDIVPSWMLVLICVMPLLVFLLMQVWRKSLHDFHHAALTLFESIMLNAIVGDFLKLFAGRQRPHWLDLCHPNAEGICTTGTVKELRQGRMSFPSGHTSASFVTMTVLTLYLFGKFGTFRKGYIWLFLVCASPMMLASFVGVSRLIDFHHHWSDVVGGALIGLVCGTLAYHLNYPPVFDPQSALPKATRIASPSDSNNNNNKRNDDQNGTISSSSSNAGRNMAAPMQWPTQHQRLSSSFDETTNEQETGVQTV